MIGRSVATSHGVSGNPVSVNTLGSAEIAVLPQNQSLNRLIQTVPGIVRFSYDEPVVHGFHGVSYEIDGAPLPQTTSTNFAEAFDPRNIDSMEIFTGAFPAEFGGQRTGAVINIVSKRDVDIPNGSQTQLTGGIGTQERAAGHALAGLALRNDRRVSRREPAADEPRARCTDGRSRSTIAASFSDVFFRTITKLGPRDTLAFDYSNQYNTYQIPINTMQTPVDSIVNVPQQDDVQREYSSFANLNYTHTCGRRQRYVQVIPWCRSDRVVYAGDLANDLLALDYSADDCAPNPAPCSLAGLSQDRSATAFGLRLALLPPERQPRAEDRASTGRPKTSSAARRSCKTARRRSSTTSPSTVRRTARTSRTAGRRRRPSRCKYGLRYDYSNGFVQGNQLQPRIGANLRIAPEHDLSRVLRPALRRAGARGHAARVPS